MKITNLLRKNIYQALLSLDLGELVQATKEQDILLEHPADDSHGDYSTNIAMVLFGQIKKMQQVAYNSPRDLSQAIVAQLESQLLQSQEFQDDSVESTVETNKIQNFSDNISKIEIAGPGFINFTLSDAFLLSKMGSVIQKGGDVIEKSLSGKKVMIEFTDPNPFKELHIGHLYSNIVGEAIAKSYESQGADVVRACYQGDVGMHVSKSIWGMKSLFAQKYPGKTVSESLKELEIEKLADKVSFLGQAYAAGATAYKQDESSESESENVKGPDADEDLDKNESSSIVSAVSAKKTIKDFNYLVFISAQENLKNSTDFKPQVDYKKFLSDFSENSEEYQEVSMLYLAGRKWSLDYFNSMYSRIGMVFDEFFFESLAGEYGYKIVGDFLKKGVFEKSKGAIIFPGSKYGLHDRVFINSLGLPTYEAKELGLAPEKYRRYKYDKSIVITGNEIDEYFKVLLKALEFTSPDLQAKTTHLSHGMVRLPEGKMSSRTGKIITAESLMNEAHTRIKNHMLETKASFTADETEVISEKVGLGAIKFAFLKQSIGKDIAFSFEESLSFNGNSGPYLQYTYVRCHSVIQKAQKTIFSELKTRNNLVENELKLAEMHEKSTLSELLVSTKNPANLGNSEDNSVSLERSITEYFDTLLNNKEYFEYSLNMDEKRVLRNLYKYSDIVKSATVEYAPHYIATYLYELAQSFGKFYGNNKIIENQFRLLLVKAVSLVIENGLNLLGIEVVEKM